jgi:alpha-beta hydrolase superfamily lysophospholipase
MIKFVHLDQKTVDWKTDTFPEQNPFQVTVEDNGETIDLANYRWKSETGQTKAVVMMFHGYGSWAGKYAYYAKHFANAGYDFVGMDFRGFGNTPGKIGHIKDLDTHLSD